MTTADTDERIPIKARRVRFDWQETPLHWVADDPQTTHTINVLHLLLPAGEKWFVELYRQVLPQVTDAGLREDVKGFIGQEATHSRAHAAVLDHLATQNVATTRYTRRIEWLFDRLLADRPIGLRLPRPLRREWTRHRLALIAAIEHFTAALGAWLLDAEQLDRPDNDPVMMDMLRWHAAEEVEHRSVAFELSEHLGGGYFRRLVGMLEVVPALLYLWIVGVAFLMKGDPTGPGRPRVRSYLRASLRAGRLPGPGALARMVPRYLRPGYHPLQEASTAKAQAYLARSPAATAARSGAV
ncbi:MAG TPA: metal-dependent hydrolase [Acidimicrobiales bacterium]|jgi:hypothetical protein